MEDNYRLILKGLNDFQVISGSEYPWIYIPKKNKKFGTGLYYFLDIEDRIREKSGEIRDREDEEVKPFFMVRSFLHGGDAFGDIWSLEKAAHYLASEGVSFKKLRRRVEEIMRVNKFMIGDLEDRTVDSLDLLDST